MLKQNIILPITVALLMCTPAVFAGQKLDIIQIMGQFVQAKHAASQCLRPDQDMVSRFNENFRIVSISRHGRNAETKARLHSNASLCTIRERHRYGSKAN
jgi:hypothetical protein